MAIIKREKLIEKTNLNKLIPLEVKVLKVENQIYLDIEEIEEFLKFARDSNFVYVYYYYTYYNLESYLIPIDSYSDEYEKKLKTEVRRYNKQLESLDFRTPKSVT
jgi:Holliday junction resolvase